MHTTEFQYIKSSHNSHIFLAHYLPLDDPSDQESRQVLVLVPPFAEELNRSKRMYVLCARQLANAGMHVICFDYSGTGDSSGEWGDFSYYDWVSDLLDVYQFSLTIASQVNFIALRFGALVLTDAILDKHISTRKCLFWDPLEAGDVLIRQLVRMKIAAAMTDNAKKITTQDVMHGMSEHGYLESAGYLINQTMFDQINSKKLAPLMPRLLDNVNVHWITSAKPSSSGNTWVANTFKQDSLTSHQMANLEMLAVGDVKFWMQQEVTIAPKLLQHTHRLLVNV